MESAEKALAENEKEFMGREIRVEMTKVKRHQLIYQTLFKTMKKIHALSIQAFTTEEFNINPVILSSPDCSNK